MAVTVLLASAGLVQRRIDAATRSEAAKQQELLVTSGPLLKKLSLGYDSLLADIYWTRAVQYYGARIGKRDANFDSLAPLLHISTTLDPRLIIAYRFGAIFLSEPRPMGAGRTDLAIDLAKRGIAANPNDWHLYYDLGYLYYWRLKDYADSSATFLAGGKVPNAPEFMKLIAARIAEKGGSIATSRVIFSQLYQSTNDPAVRKAALRQLRALRAEDDIAHLDDIIGAFRKRFGRNPASIRELNSAGLLPGIPADPGGFPYIIGRDGKAHLDPDSPVELPK
jgi:tetratricopeptide (TPR) repeat protein